ncbi:MAG: hypothetical protein R2827_13045 [Bdellovibrionales bacterium]
MHFELKSIIFAGEESIAYINGQEVFLNTVIDGFRVLEIGTNYVLLEKNDSYFRIATTLRCVTGFGKH